MNKKAFTIIEILIAITVILILATAVLGNSGGIIRSMRFNNAFNKMVFMVQRARSLAIAGKNAGVEKYAVTIDLSKNTADLFKYAKSVTSPESIELLTFADTSNLYLKAATNIECITTAVATFLNGASEPNLECDTTINVNTLKITLQELDASDKDKVIREKTFSINHISGVPQL